jgi:hypothetical protein
MNASQPRRAGGFVALALVVGAQSAAAQPWGAAGIGGAPQPFPTPAPTIQTFTPWTPTPVPTAPTASSTPCAAVAAAAGDADQPSPPRRSDGCGRSPDRPPTTEAKPQTPPTAQVSPTPSDSPSPSPSALPGKPSGIPLGWVILIAGAALVIGLLLRRPRR